MLVEVGNNYLEILIQSDPNNNKPLNESNTSQDNSVMIPYQNTNCRNNFTTSKNIYLNTILIHNHLINNICKTDTWAPCTPKFLIYFLNLPTHSNIWSDFLSYKRCSNMHLSIKSYIANVLKHKLELNTPNTCRNLKTNIQTLSTGYGSKCRSILHN